MKRLQRIRAGLVIVMICFLMSILSGCFLPEVEAVFDPLAKELKSLSKESDEEAAYFAYGSLLSIDVEDHTHISIDLKKVIKDVVPRKDECNAAVLDRVVLYDGTLAWVHFYELDGDDAFCVALATYDSKSGELDIKMRERSEVTWSDYRTNRYSSNCSFPQKRQYNIAGEHSLAPYPGTLPYKNRRSYFLNGVFVLTDYDQVYEYSLKTGQVHKYEYSAYEYPSLMVTGTLQGRGMSVRFCRDGVEKELFIQEAEKSSEAFHRMWVGMKNVMLRRKDLIDGLITPFSEVYSEDDHLYVVCIGYSVEGNAYEVTYSYDFDENRLSYINYYQAETTEYEVVPVIDLSEYLSE